MARSNRIQCENTVYHLITNANSDELLFKDNTDKIYYLNLWHQAKAEFNFNCFGFCLMDTRTHFIIKTSLPNLSRFIHTIHNSYVKFFNRKYARTGTLIRDRFKSILLEDDAHLLSTIRYIHLNPVKAGIVNEVEEYFWSSSLIYSGVLKNQLVDTEFVLNLFGNANSNTKEKIEEYKKFLLDDTECTRIIKGHMTK